MQTTEKTTYQMERESFYQDIPNYWADLDNTEYSTYNVYNLTQTQKENMHKAVREITPALKQTIELLRNVPDETLIEMGYPERTIPYLKLKRNSMDNTIGRFDMMLEGDTPKIIEFNADTPTFIKELFHVSGKLCAHKGENDINAGEEEALRQYMMKAIRSAIKDSGKERPYVLYVAHGASKEDYLTIQYLAGLVGAPFAPLEELEIIPGDGLYHNGHRVDILYRQTWAVEIIIQDVDENGVKIGEELLKLVEESKLEVINPPASFILQNKMLLALMYHLAEEGNPIYTPEMVKAIQTYLPKSAFYQEDLGEVTSFVEKPIFGREGNSVSILTATDTIKAQEQDFASQPKLYQEFIAPTMTVIDSNNGQQTGNLVFGVFCLGLERPSAIGARFTEGSGITGNNAMFVAISAK